MNGYLPHAGQQDFVCARCGNNTFVSHPQAIPTDGRTWTFEYECAKCGQTMGLTVLGDEE